MKPIIAIYLIACLLVLKANAQKVTVAAVSVNTNELTQEYLVTIPHTTLKETEKSWSSFLKDHRAKVKSSKGEVTATNFLLRGTDTMNVMSKLRENSDQSGGVMLDITFTHKNATGPVTDGSNDPMMITLTDFAKPVAKEALTKKMEAAEEVHQQQTKTHDNLVKRNESLKKSNEKMKEEITDNEREMGANDKKIDGLKEEMNKQNSTLELIKLKMKELD